MARTGRPKQNGYQKADAFVRNTIALLAYHSARSRGEKYEFSLEAAVKAVKQYDPSLKISVSTMKRILSVHMPKTSEQMHNVTKYKPGEKLGYGEVARRVTFALGTVPRAKYPHPTYRSNPV